MKLRERDYWLGFNVFPGIGPKRFYQLLKIFGSAKKAWQAKTEKLLATKIPKPILERFFVFREQWQISSELLRLEKSLIRFIIVDDQDYPINLKKINTPPFLLYVKGQLLPQDALSIAVIGTRQITPYGREVTERLVAGLSAYNLTIVSGLARGVDSAAHRIALGNGGRTLAVLGSGLDRIYPPEHQGLANQIVKSGQGALLSELPLGTAPLRGHFPHRNRIIAGLSLAVLVTEGATVSGTKITSDYALAQGKKLFAVPGPITSPLSEGPADLIKKGAKLVTKVEDVLENLKIGPPFAKAPAFVKTTAGKTAGEKKFNHPEEELVWQTLVTGSKHIDELARLTRLPSSKLLSYLTSLELLGMVKSIGQGNYMIT